MLVHVIKGELDLRADGAEPVRIPQGQILLGPRNRNVQAFNVADGSAKITVFAPKGRLFSGPPELDPARQNRVQASAREMSSVGKDRSPTGSGEAGGLRGPGHRGI